VEKFQPALSEGQYFSIASPIDYEMTIKRSRFIASMRIVSDREEFDVAYREIMSKYPGANHYCWGYRFAAAPVHEHSSDAGEPVGTAGRPILGALKKYSLLNVMAVVTRYFGGIKLGIRGLISAYGESANEAIEHAGIVVREPVEKLSFKCSYDLYNTLLELMKRREINTEDINSEFEETISGEIAIPKSKLAALKNDLEKLKHQGNIFECRFPGDSGHRSVS
jgi:uncharacterized YigZ family protein